MMCHLKPIVKRGETIVGSGQGRSVFVGFWQVREEIKVEECEVGVES